MQNDSKDKYVNIKVAYACKIGDNTSVIYERLFDKKSFDYLLDPQSAKEIINFEKESYIIECKCNSNGNKVKIKIIFEMGKLGVQFKQK